MGNQIQSAYAFLLKYLVFKSEDNRTVQVSNFIKQDMYSQVCKLSAGLTTADISKHRLMAATTRCHEVSRNEGSPTVVNLT